MVKMGGNIDVGRIGELDTKNDDDVVTSEATACCTGMYDVFGDPVAISGVSASVSISSCFRFHALWQEIKSTSSHMGLANPSGRRLVVDVSRLGAIIFSVMTSGLYGTIPVFAKATRILLSVNMQTCAFT